MKTSKVLYLIGFISYLLTVLYLFMNFSNEKLYTGIVFYSVAIVFYLSFVYLYYKSTVGKKIVGLGLVVIGTISFLLLFIQK
ncbi:hypothetical protein [Radiobacillus sp. PE A8.2]|uniref:hypothetical protein n=1 Tax=Radiobacillus sp. PE A8.2 TaxID=3380349 RepID=UPI00388E2160